MLKLQDISKRLAVSRATVLSWIQAGQLAAIDVAPAGAKNHQYRVSLDDLLAFEAGRSVRKVARPSRPAVRSWV